MPPLAAPDAAAVEKGLPNLEKHVESIRAFGETPVVALNRFGADTDEEVAMVQRRCETLGAPFAVSDHYARGGDGALDLARTLVQHADRTARPFRPLYERRTAVPEKIRAVARAMYGADDVSFTARAERDLRDVIRLGHDDLPVCIAKVPGSLSDDPSLRGRPRGFRITVREIQVAAGAGFLVVLTGDILRMPGLPKEPRAEKIDLLGESILGVE